MPAAEANYECRIYPIGRQTHPVHKQVGGGVNPSPETAASVRFDLVGKGYDPDRLLTVEDLAGRLQVSAAWVRDHATRKQPRLPVVRIGKLLRFRREEIEKWIREQSQRPC